MDQNEIETIKGHFPNMDEAQALAIFRSLDLPEGEEIESLMAKVDVDKNGKIEY